ncbi:hypothetical protein [Kingella potus]|uniref:hypothetical protein n=1 Tax=Kingella potus TaxID=265175 RepID=UPI001FD593DB|nr:hypothetical protein [Kingella potus]UOP00876.1 hypothetical protein LVJ84_00060 [Kingella potus]
MSLESKLKQALVLWNKVMTPEFVAGLTSTERSEKFPAHIVCDWPTPVPIVFVTEVNLDYERKLAAKARDDFEKAAERYPEIKAKLFDSETQEEGLRELAEKALLAGLKIKAKDSDRCVYVLGSKPPFKHEWELSRTCTFAPITPYLHELLGLGFVYPLHHLFDPKSICGLSGEALDYRQKFKIEEAFERRHKRYKAKRIQQAEDMPDGSIDFELCGAIHDGKWHVLTLLKSREDEAGS